MLPMKTILVLLGIILTIRLVHTSTKADCFRDCLSSDYAGIRSTDTRGYKCVRRMFIYRGGAMCYTVHGSGEFHIPVCRRSFQGEFCIKSIDFSNSATRITIKWSIPFHFNLIGFVVLLFNADNICMRYQIQKCQGCPARRDVNNYYLSCGSGTTTPETGEITFNDLEPDKSYKVYIIPVGQRQYTEDVTRISIKTLIAKPATPIHVSIREKKLRSILFTWKGSEEHADADHYLVTLIKSDSNKETLLKSTKESAEFVNLDLCTEYCLKVVAVNQFGQSEQSAQFCSHTLATGLGSINLNNMDMGSSSNRVMSWRYSGSWHCSTYFRIEYGPKYQPFSDFIESKYSSVELLNLDKNTIYAARVRAETKMEVEKNIPFGPYSEIKYFYTGQERPAVEEYREYVDLSGSHINISFTFGRIYNGSIYELIIRLMHPSQSCLLSVKLVCSASTRRYNHTSSEDLRQSLLNCTNMEEHSFSDDMDNFRATLHKDKRLKEFYVEIYALNPIGVHKVHTKYTFSDVGAPTTHQLQFQDVFDGIYTGRNERLIRLVTDDAYTKINYRSKDNESINVLCNFGELVQFGAKFRGANTTFEAPFNASCGIQAPANVVTHVTSKELGGRLCLYWNVTNVGAHRYVIYWMGEAHHLIRSTIGEHQTFCFDTPGKNDLHQTCIAIIDLGWRTSRYSCSQYHETPGAVIDLQTHSTENGVHISWRKMKQDVHHGYLVNVLHSDGRCRSTIINMINHCVEVRSPCKHINRIRWSFLKFLTIEGLIPNSKYNISVSAIKGNNTSPPNIVIVKTKIPETVSDLRVYGNSSNIFIQFKAARAIEDANTRYRLKVTMRSTNMCNYKTWVMFDDLINDTSKHLTANRSLDCLEYQVVVIPVRKCDLRGCISSDIPLYPGRFPYNITKRPTMFREVNVVMQSVHLLKISWSNIIPQNECNDFGVMAELVAVENESDCTVWILTQLTCTKMVEGLHRHSRCSNRVFLSYRNEWIKKSILLHGYFRVATNYKVKIWRITSQIELLLERQVKYEDISGCFRDCYGWTYNGISSGTVDGRICLEWKTILNDTGKYRSNICHLDRDTDGAPWCIYDEYVHRVNCDIPKCDDTAPNAACSGDIQLWASQDKIRIRLPVQIKTANAAVGYVILLHDHAHVCRQYVIMACTNCLHILKITRHIQSLYMSCREGANVNRWLNETTFVGLRTHTEYFVYIVPLIDFATVGPIKNISIATTISGTSLSKSSHISCELDPIIPNYIRVTRRELESLQFSWSSLEERGGHYLSTLVNMRSKDEVSNRSHQRVADFHDLNICTTYCFFITFVDELDRAVPVDSLCTSTLPASRGEVYVHNIESGPSLRRTVSWTYLGNDDCARHYGVEISDEYSNKTFVKTTNKTEVFLGELESNMTYAVRVWIETKMGNNYTYPKVKKFFTGAGPGLVRVSDLRSGPEGWRRVSWIYSGPTDLKVHYRVQCTIKYANETSYLTTNETNTIVDRLKKNMIYNVRVRAETQRGLSNETLLGDYSALNEFYTGLANPKISDMFCHLDPSKTILNSFWRLEKSSIGSMFEFVIRVSAPPNKCLHSINYVCASCTLPHQRRYSGSRWISKLEELLRCDGRSVETFTRDVKLFDGTINSTRVLQNVTVTLFGLSLVGVHKLYEKSL